MNLFMEDQTMTRAYLDPTVFEQRRVRDKAIGLRSMLFILALVAACRPAPSQASPGIDYEAFLGQHDMVWDRVPHRWEVAPYSGNGNIGFLLYQAAGEAKNVVSLYVGRHDYYDHRLPHEGNELLWIYRGRLPLGHFKLKSRGEILGVDLRLSLWNAELTGEIRTTEGAYQVHGLTHSLHDVIHFETRAQAGESISVSWHPDTPMPPVRARLDTGAGPKGGIWDLMREAPLPMPPAPTTRQADGITYCKQLLHEHRGETTTAWEVTGVADGHQRLHATVHHSFPQRNSQEVAQKNLAVARQRVADHSLVSTHRAWWHAYYPQSFLTVNDAEKEAFYWIQMYKLASAMRGNGPILDLMGPWYHTTFWPMVWGDLNVQLIYWTHLTSNRLSVGASLPNNMDKYADNLARNVPDRWTDSAAVAALMPQDLIADNGPKVPDMLVWMLHNYWLHCEYAGDRERMRDGLFPLLRKAVNAYRHYLADNPVASADGTLHIKRSWSPEYPAGRGQDVNFTLALMRWSCQTLLDLNAEHGLNDPLAEDWQRILDRLAPFQTDENGLRIGKDIPFEKPHRHYSHLLGFYPLAVITPEEPADADLLRTTLDHWLNVSINGVKKDKALPVTGYTATGAASMYAWLGDAEKAHHYLDYLIQHQRVSPTTMYAEGNPVIESPLSFATSVHDMLLQSWGGTLRVFRATPKHWEDAAFQNLRGQGAFLVSAKKTQGITRFVTVESLAGAPCSVQIDFADPFISIDGSPAASDRVRLDEHRVYHLALEKGQTAAFTPVPLAEADLSITPPLRGASDHHLFGFSKQTERLPGHRYYSKNKPSRRGKK